MDRENWCDDKPNAGLDRLLGLHHPAQITMPFSLHSRNIPFPVIIVRTDPLSCKRRYVLSRRLGDQRRACEWAPILQP